MLTRHGASFAKQCCHCKQRKPHLSFYKDKQKVDGLSSRCKHPCSYGRMLAVDHDHNTSELRGLLRSMQHRIGMVP